MYEDETTDVGNQLRSLRQQRALSIRALAEMCDLSPNTVSLIERGITSPSVSTLHRLATALGVPITAFFNVQVETVPIILTRAGERPRSGSASVLLESLGTNLEDQTLEPFVVTLRAGASSGPKMMAHPDHELVYCLDGELEYEVDDLSHRLEAGDSLLFDARLPHRWKNPGQQPAVFLLIFQTRGKLRPVEQHLHP